MGSHCNPSKRHYDITLSKRTRKPLDLQEANGTSNIASSKWDNPLKIFPRKAADDDDDDEDEGEESSDHKSLKQLINGDGGEAEETSCRLSGRSSLGQHFNQEEKQLQLVKKNQQDGVYGGVKLKGMMSRYAKVLSRLVKAKREPRLGSNKKHLLRLTM
ncbi:hypothetical protein QQP08_020255 [Theobroma cacao]|nr:hypothetical protein QQP08_020255 [Theobroma cacao]